MGTTPPQSPVEHSWWRYALLWVPVFLILGSLSGWVSNSGYGNDWFDALEKPAEMPPGWVFGTVWTCLYALLGLALSGLLSAPRSERKTYALALFGGQMALNFGWSPVFFGLHQPKPALAMIVAMLFATVALMMLLPKLCRASAWMLTPYIGWLCFAGFLNWRIIALNSV